MLVSLLPQKYKYESIMNINHTQYTKEQKISVQIHLMLAFFLPVGGKVFQQPMDGFPRALSDSSLQHDGCCCIREIFSVKHQVNNYNDCRIQQQENHSMRYACESTTSMQYPFILRLKNKTLKPKTFTQCSTT